MKIFKFTKLHWFVLLLVGVAAGLDYFLLGATFETPIIMGSLLATLMQELRSSYTSQFDKNELRPSAVGALNFFMDEMQNRPIFDPETLNNIIRSYGNSVEVPVLDAETITLTVPYTRTCALVDSENTSAIITLTFQSYGWGFTMTPATSYNNDVKMQQDFNRKFEKFRIEFEKVLDSGAINTLETDKNQLWTNIVPQYYAEVGDALQIPQAEKDDFYNNLEAIFTTMDFPGQVHVIPATSHLPMVRRLDNQGSSNATNQGFQFDLRSYRWWPTNRIPNGAAVESTGYAVEAGSCFIGNRNDADTSVGYSINGGSKVWGQEMVPVGENMINMGTFYQQDCADRSAIAGAATAGNTRSRVDGFEFSTDIVYATVYNSDLVNRYNPIVKFEVLT